MNMKLSSSDNRYTTVLWYLGTWTDGTWVFHFSPIGYTLLCFPVNWWENPCVPLWQSIPQDGNVIDKNQLYFGKSAAISFPGFPHRMSSATYSNAMGYLWQYPSISHGMKYTIGCNGSTHTLGKYGDQFPKLSL